MERPKLQRLFSSFPGGAPGIGLLLLRVTVGVALVSQGSLSLVHRDGSAGVVAIAGLWMVVGLALLTGSFTPVAAVLGAILVAARWLAPSVLAYPDMGKGEALLLVMAASAGLLGPGAYSVDARVFGRREIEVPRSDRRGE
jgi:hypothetical protein